MHLPGFVDGNPHPWVWTVTFVGAMPALDASVLLNEAGVTYMGGHSEPMPGGIRAGLSRHRLAVEAPSGEDAVQKVRDVLGALANGTGDWTHEPGDDETVRFHLDE